MRIETYDVLVVGGGHAGLEAAMAASSLGVHTGLVTMNLEMVGQMPCNPAVGGLGKSQITREVDAMGGWIGRLADSTAIQFRTLNTKKGPAVRALRTQNDKTRYRTAALNLLQNQPHLDLIQDEVTGIMVESNTIIGVETHIGVRISARSVIITPGTFLNGMIHIGLTHQAAGRLGEFPSSRLSRSLMDHGLELQRLKTGTPARIDRRTIDFSRFEVQPGDDSHPYFSHWTPPREQLPQIVCHLAYTNEKTHEIIRSSLDRSPLYSGKITGIGPRYCPSIEDKVVRFPEKTQHQIFLEPEGLDSVEIYANGISTSLPYDVQVAMIQSIDGLENARLIRPAYAVEYDFVPPTQLNLNLETKHIHGVFLAGQINGTSGYEEAAGQGLMAGLNAVRYLSDREPLILRRDQAYIGVMIDDLVTRGVDEPYRMFTSRAEYRLLLRSDNADSRLTAIGHAEGLISDNQYNRFERKEAQLAREHARLEDTRLSPSAETNLQLSEAGLKPIQSPMSLKELLRRQDISYFDLQRLDLADPNFDAAWAEILEIRVNYEGYIERQLEEIHRFGQQETLRLPDNLDYGAITGLSHEVRQRLAAVRPRSLGQAARVPGVTPAAITVLAIWMKLHGEGDRESRI